MLSLILLTFFISSEYSLAQGSEGLRNRVNLEDVEIQGEGGRRGAMLQKRNRFDLDERVKVRKSFMKELEEKIPPGMEKVPNKSL